MKWLQRLLNSFFRWLTHLFQSSNEADPRSIPHKQIQDLKEDSGEAEDQPSTGETLTGSSESYDRSGKGYLEQIEKEIERLQQQSHQETSEKNDKGEDEMVAPLEDPEPEPEPEPAPDLEQREEEVVSGSTPTIPSPENQKSKRNKESKRKPVETPAESSVPEKQESPVSTAERSGDIVNITAYSPEEVKKGTSFLLTVFAHLYEQRADVQELATELDPENRRQGSKTLNTPIPPNGRLFFQLTMENWKITEPVLSMTWFGVPASVEFEIEVPREFEKERAIGSLVISNEHGPVGRMRFNVSLDESQAEATQVPETSSFAQTESRSYGQAYLSFAAEDQAFVDQYLKEFKGNQINTVLSVQTEDANWEDQLLAHLHESELFLLFWSTHAKRSQEVKTEWQTALGLRYHGEDRLPDLVPIMVGESWPPPPSDLAFLNFSSRSGSTQSTHRVGQEDIESLKAQCEQYIAEGNVEVFDLMREYFEADDRVVNDLYSLENQWNTAKRKSRLKLWSEEQVHVANSQITFSVLGLIGQMK